MHKAMTWAMAAALLCVACATHASVVEWTLKDVAFEFVDDGGTASGRITYDITSNLVTDFNILVTAGNLITSPFQYRPATATLFQSNAPGNAFLQLTATGADARDLFLEFNSPLTAAGGSIPLVHGPGSFEQQFPDPRLPPLIREVVRGEIVAGVPEPAQLAYLTLGAVLILGRYLRAKTRASRTPRRPLARLD